MGFEKLQVLVKYTKILKHKIQRTVYQHNLNRDHLVRENPPSLTTAPTGHSCIPVCEGDSFSIGPAESALILHIREAKPEIFLRPPPNKASQIGLFIPGKDIIKMQVETKVSV